MKFPSTSLLFFFLTAASNALEHPVSLVPSQRELDHLHDAYNSFQELQNELQTQSNAIDGNHHRALSFGDGALGDGVLALGDSLLCRFQLASCQTLTATANVELWAESLQPMGNTTMGPLLNILSLTTDVAQSLAELAGLGTMTMVLNSADSVLTILSNLFGNLRNTRESSFDTMSAIDSMDVIVQETGLAFSSLGAVWAEFWGSITAAWAEAKGIVTEAYGISETLFVTMYRDVIKASVSFMMSFWTTTIEFVTTAGSQQKMACATGSIECSYEMWTYEMFPSLATLSMIIDSKPKPVSNGTQTGPVSNATQTEPVSNATQPEPTSTVANATAPEPPVANATTSP